LPVISVLIWLSYAAGRISGKVIPVQEDQRREGDPGRLVANADKIKLHAYADLDTIVEHALRWESKCTLGSTD